jgi:hypothetical protein
VIRRAITDIRPDPTPPCDRNPRRLAFLLTLAAAVVVATVPAAAQDADAAAAGSAADPRRIDSVAIVLPPG